MLDLGIALILGAGPAIIAEDERGSSSLALMIQLPYNRCG
jgi:hypothetical protein